ncbi:hypothetical protein B0H10DRAFT_601349 [Mycena sp. CBHHK59/15]|nr:hypothetical protein B0H10DRAFT_601349 [Mycena sp. CBHHK59/15]
MWMNTRRFYPPLIGSHSQEIFLACIPTHRNTVMTRSEAEPPVLLGRVCRAWRGISLSTPCLWASLHIVDPVSRTLAAELPSSVLDQKIAQRVETTRNWFGRSGQCPLSISLYSVRDGAPPIPSNLNSPHILEAMILFSSRCSQLGLRLSSVEIHCHHSADADWNSFQFLRAPGVRSFSLHGGKGDTSGLPLQWNRLTTLSLLGYDWSLVGLFTSRKASKVLSQFNNLCVCQLHIRDDQR